MSRHREDLMPGRTVLLVEDDDAFRYAAARELAAAGLRVIEAKDTMTALTRVDEGATAECLVADIQMPAGVPHGLALANMLRARHPKLVVVFVTAYAELANAIRALDGTSAVYVKPVDLPRFAAEVRDKLAAAYPN